MQFLLWIIVGLMCNSINAETGNNTLSNIANDKENMNVAGNNVSENAIKEKTGRNPEKILFNFDQQNKNEGENVEGWAPLWGNEREHWEPLKFAYSTNEAVSGRFSAYLKCPMYIAIDPAYAKYEYSSIGFKYDPPMDYSNYNFLTMDIFCPDTEDNYLRIVLIDSNGKYTGDAGNIAIPAQKKLNLKLPLNMLMIGANDGKALNKKMISQIGFTRKSTIRPYRFYIDNIKLENLEPAKRRYHFSSVAAALQFGSAGKAIKKEGFTLVGCDAQYRYVPSRFRWLRRFTLVGRDNQYLEGKDFGWESKYELDEKHISASDDKIDPIASSYIFGKNKARFIVRTKPGVYKILILTPHNIDFHISINGGIEERMQTVSFYGHRTMYAKTKDGLINILFNPVTKWGIMAMAIYPENNTENLDKDFASMLVADVQCAPWSIRSYMTEEFDINNKKDASNPTPAEKERGYQIYVNPTSALLRYNSIPDESDLICRDKKSDNEIVLNIGKNEWESRIVGVFSLESVSISAGLSEFVDSHGKALPKNCLELKVAMPYYTRSGNGYVKIPRLLLPADGMVAPSPNQPFWLMAKNLTPGVYKGKIIIKRADRNNSETLIPVTLNCLDMELDQLNDINFGVYSYADTFNQDCFSDMKNHGINYIETVLSLPMEKDSSGKIVYSKTGMDGFFNIYKQYFTKRICFAFIFARQAICRILNVQPSSKEYLAEQTRMINQLKTWEKNEKWPEILYYDFDEAGWDSTSPLCYRAAKGAGMRTYSTSCGEYGVRDRISKEDGIDIYVYPNGGSDIDPIKQKAMIKSSAADKEMHCYYVLPTHFRWEWGLHTWAGQFDGVQIWHYCCIGSSMSSSIYRGTWSYFLGYGLPEGRSISTPDWENIRMGIVDYKVIRTLENLIDHDHNMK